MIRSICGIDCNECELKNNCEGCIETKGHPFQGGCIIAACCQNKGHVNCDKCQDPPCKLKARLIIEFNALSKALGIEDMEEVTDLNALKGSYINLTYKFPSGQFAQIWEDEKIYLGSQMDKKNSDRCYGLAADEKYLLICEYGADGQDAEIIAYRKWAD